MTGLLEAVRDILEPERIVPAPMTLDEEAEASRCPPVQVRGATEHWALRLRSDDHLPILAALAKEHSVRRLPDYLVFSEPRVPAQRPEDVALQVLVCELKSSAVGAESALAQVQLGKLLAEYLVRVAAHTLGESEAPKLWCCGLIASPEFPASLLAKGSMRPGKVELPNRFDKLSRMRIYHSPGGVDLRLESFFS
ncbi:hypothetical protein KYC5002_50965 [Archangium violaceum]|uniref:hypothetical protein n=1 Tax=Archangium violaceum TaxID=83451 RepID=UPI002B2DBB56|nr:hypothetical protein KYC5002_50965 [Archangium gephyra]